MSTSETGRFRFEDRMPPMRVPLQRRSISPKPDRKFFLPCFLLFFCCPRAARSPAGGPPGLYGCLGAMIRPMCDLRQGRPAVFFEPTPGGGGGTPPAWSDTVRRTNGESPTLPATRWTTRRQPAQAARRRAAASSPYPTVPRSRRLAIRAERVSIGVSLRFACGVSRSAWSFGSRRPPDWAS